MLSEIKHFVSLSGVKFYITADTTAYLLYRISFMSAIRSIPYKSTAQSFITFITEVDIISIRFDCMKQPMLYFIYHSGISDPLLM